MMKRLVHVGRLHGVPVHVHWTVLAIVLLMIVAAVESAGMTLVGALCYLGILLLHEWGHLTAAHRRGLTVLSIELYPMHGRTWYVAPSRAYDTYVIAWGGVLAQLLVALPIVAWLTVFGFTRANGINAVLALFGYVNAWFAAMNLLPIAPLDGALAWRIVPHLWRRTAWRSIRGTRSRQKPGLRGPWAQ